MRDNCSDEIVAPFCVVISTLGRRDELRRLLQSLAAQSVRPASVGIADQSESDRVERIVEEFADDLPIFVVKTGRRGLSRGRNDVIAASPPCITHFLFPNDTSHYGPEFLSALVGQLDDADVIALNYEDSDGPRVMWRSVRAGEVTELRVRDVFSLIEPGMVVRAERLLSVGGFDESIGTGSASPRQSGEGTDLLLRMLDRAPVRVKWLPGLVVHGVPQGHGLTRAAESRKAYGYGYGYGFLLQERRFSKLRRMRSLIGPLALSAVGRQPWRVGIATACGRLKGMCAARRRT